jgi:hypothetical protein
MRFLVFALALVLSSQWASAADRVDPLARARELYNQKDFQGSISAAEDARRIAPARADSADLIVARSYIERFRVSEESTDLTNARERLRRLNPGHLSPNEHLELLIGLGEVLYFEDSIGAAAEVFDSLLVRTDLTPDSREHLLDWWATALDRDARQRTEFERLSVYQRIRDRMRTELGTDPTNAAASYWLAAAARNQGDWRGAWDAAQAGWVRAALVPEREILRADIEELMVIGILPARARAQAESVDTLRMEWEAFKIRWENP